MHQPQIKKKKAFTLVELIIVITILAILGTIAFISFQGYTKDTRDSVRLTDVKSIYDGLSIYKVQTSTTLLPDDYIEIQSGTTTISYQGYAGDIVQRGINLKNGGTDPLSKNYYIYTTDVSAKKIQLMTYLETADKDVELLSYKDEINNLNLINQAYSSNTDTGYYEDKKIYVYGDKIGILTDENNVPLQETITSTGINLLTNTGTITTYFGGDVYDNGKSTNTGTTLINEINGAINNTLPCSPTTYEGYSITSLQDSQSGSFTKPLTIDYGSGTGTIIATCNNGVLSYESLPDQISCTSPYEPSLNNCVLNNYFAGTGISGNPYRIKGILATDSITIATSCNYYNQNATTNNVGNVRGNGTCGNGTQECLNNGVYLIDADGNGGNNALQVYCDMNSSLGGWTLAGFFVRQPWGSGNYNTDYLYWYGNYSNWSNNSYNTGEILSNSPSTYGINSYKGKIWTILGGSKFMGVCTDLAGTSGSGWNGKYFIMNTGNFSTLSNLFSSSGISDYATGTFDRVGSLFNINYSGHIFHVDSIRYAGSQSSYGADGWCNMFMYVK